jgi:hypothetical protein
MAGYEAVGSESQDLEPERFVVLTALSLASFPRRASLRRVADCGLPCGYGEYV